MACPSKVCNPVGGNNPSGLVDSKASPEIKEGMKELILDNDTLKKQMDIMLDNVQRGLKKETHPDCALKCFPTYVQDLPNGTEQGKFLALDLGGSHFRVLLVELDIGKCDLKSDVYDVPQDIMLGTGIQLFDHIAECLAKFAKSQGVADAGLPLGFTFSFPLEQRGLCVGILQKWTKGFNVQEVVGGDVVQWLIEAINRRDDVKIDVCAVLNDTTGTLMSCAWKAPDCRIGLIVGTGSNSCYYELQENAELFDEPNMGSGRVVINLELAALGDDGALDFLRTDVDMAIDAESINPGKQVHEKMISGMFLGEIVRRYALRFTEAGLMFGGQSSDALKEKNSFECEYISEIESEPVGTFTKMREILDKLGLGHATEQDCNNLRYICQVISRRSAYLLAADMAVLIPKVNEPKITIGVDGSVYRFHPHFGRVLDEKISELLVPGYKFQLMLSEDGSGRGAALVAAVAARVKQRAA